MPILLHVINDLAIGGAQRILLDHAVGLDRSRWTVHIASLELVPRGGLLTAYERAGLIVHPLRVAREPRLLAALRLPGLVRRVAPDLVHTHLAAADVCGRLSARAAGVSRIVTTFHNLSDWEEDRGHPLRRLERATLHLAHRLIAVSDAVRDALLRVVPEAARRIVTVRNGVPLETLRPRRGERAMARAALGYAPGDFVIGAVARLDPHKGIDTLVEAAARAAGVQPRLRLLVVGDGPERGRLESLARLRGISSRVRFAGDRPDVPHLLAAMDLFAAPSRTEALGVAILEALAAGIPAFGSRVGGIPELIEDGGCGRLLPPDAPIAWSEALAAIVSDPVTLANMGAAATRRAREFSLADSVVALERVYDELLASRVSLREAA